MRRLRALARRRARHAARGRGEAARDGQVRDLPQSPRDAGQSAPLHDGAAPRPGAGRRVVAVSPTASSTGSSADLGRVPTTGAPRECSAIEMQTVQRVVIQALARLHRGAGAAPSDQLQLRRARRPTRSRSRSAARPIRCWCCRSNAISAPDRRRSASPSRSRCSSRSAPSSASPRPRSVGPTRRGSPALTDGDRGRPRSR